MSRSPIKKFLIVVIVFIFLFTLGVNLFFLPSIKDPILKSLHEKIPVDLKVARAFYLFPNILILSRCEVKGKAGSQEFNMNFPQVIAYFSPWKAKIRLWGSAGDAAYFNFDGSFRGDGFSFSRLNIKKKDLQCQFWGELASSLLQLNGFVLMDTIRDESVLDSSEKTFLSKLKGLGRNFGFWAGEDLSFEPNIFILDLSARLKLSTTRIDVQRLGFSLNDLPFSLSGSLDFENLKRVDFLLSTYPGHVQNQWNLPFKESTMKVQGMIQDSKFWGQAEWSFKPRQKSQAPFSLEEIKMVLQNMEFGVTPEQQISVEAPLFQFSFQSDAKEHKFFCQEFGARLTLQTPAYQYFESHGSCYGGTMENRGWIDFSSRPPQLWASLRLTGMEAGQMKELLEHFSSVHGKLSSSLFLKTTPELNIQGQIDLIEGRLDDFDFFNWIAETFGLKSFKELVFENAGSSFSIDSKGINLEDILLTSPRLKVQGYFKKDVYEMVTSRLSLFFSKELLWESPQFKALVKGIEEDPVNFDFQLSGNIQAMNFQWLDNETKRKVADRIPGFIERKIERGIEEMR